MVDFSMKYATLWVVFVLSEVYFVHYS